MTQQPHTGQKAFAFNICIIWKTQSNGKKHSNKTMERQTDSLDIIQEGKSRQLYDLCKCLFANPIFPTSVLPTTFTLSLTSVLLTKCYLYLVFCPAALQPKCSVQCLSLESSSCGRSLSLHLVSRLVSLSCILALCLVLVSLCPCVLLSLPCVPVSGPVSGLVSLCPATAVPPVSAH